MSTLQPTADNLTARAVPDERTDDVAVTWLTSADHKVIGRMFIAGSVATLLAGLVLGLLLGIDRISGDGTFLDSGALPQLFTGHRLALLYGGLAPLMLGLAILVVPLQLGARSLALPRLALAGFWTWLGGLALVVIALAGNGGPFGGDAKMVQLFIAGHAVLVLGLLAAAASVATTVLTTRAPGMRLHRVPFFSWSALVMSIGLLIVLPIVVGASVFLFADHRYGRTLFSGNAGISTWIGWAWTHPTTYLLALPAFGILAELVPVTFQRRTPMRGVAFAGLALIGVAALAGATQRQHVVRWDGSFGDKLQDLVVWAFFMLLPVLGALIVTAIAALTAKPSGDGTRPRITAPFVFAFLGAELVFVGMLAGAVHHIVDLGLVGTVFEEGTLTLVVLGGVLAALGGLAYWVPVWTGRLLPDKPIGGLALLGALGVVLVSAPYLIAGFADQPANTSNFDYGGPSALWNVLVTIGYVLVVLSVAGVAAAVIGARLGRTPVAEKDPWHGHTLEWFTTAPAPAINFVEPPTVMSPEPVYDLRATPNREDHA